MESKMTIKEFISRDVWNFAVEDRYKDQLCKLMEDNVVKFKVKHLLWLPEVGWFYEIETWTAGEIGPVKFLIEHLLSDLRNEESKKD